MNKNLKSAMLLFCTIIFFCASNAATAQTTAKQNLKKQIGTYIGYTNFPIREVNKHFISKKQTPEQQPEYANAKLLQQYAENLFKNGKVKDALICSSKARKIAIAVLTKLTNEKVAQHYAHFPNEKKSFAILQNDKTTAQYWLNKINKK